LHAAQRAVAIARGGKVAKFAGAFGKSGKHGVAMGNGFVAGKFERAGEGLGGLDGLFFHDGVTWIQFITARFGLLGDGVDCAESGARKAVGRAQEKRRRDPSTTRPDAPQFGAEEKVGSLRSE